MLVDYATLPETARVFVYPSSRKFYVKELAELTTSIQQFIENWKNLDAPLTASFHIKYNRFIIITVYTTEGTLAAKTIDALVQFIFVLQEKYDILLIDKMNVCFKQGTFVQYKDLKDFKKLVKNKAVSAKTIVFDNLIQTKGELEEAWEIPIADSWYARFL